MAERSVALVGDVMLGRKVAPFVDRYGPEYIWGDVLTDLRAADFAVGNLECAITERTEEAWPERVFHFRAPPAAAQALKSAGFRYVSLANNHALDFGAAGMLDTLDALDEAGIRHAGAGDDLDAARRPVVVDEGGVRLGLLSAADHPEEWRAGADRPGIFRIRVPPDEDDWTFLQAAIGDLRTRADVVVMSLHWGPNMRTRPTDTFQRFARRLVEEGVDVLHGHSAHVLQPIETRDGGVILYDCGDFVDDYARDSKLRNDFALIHIVFLDEGGSLDRLELVPCRIDPLHGRVNHADAESRAEILRRVAAGLDEFGTRYERRARRLVVPLGPPPDRRVD